jgi:hypothetical protein
MPAGPSCAGRSDASSDRQRIPASPASRAQRHARPVFWARASGGAAVSNTDGWGFDTFRACLAPGSPSGHQHLDNCTDIVVEASATWLRHGSVAPWGAAGCRPAVFPTSGVRFPPGPPRAPRRAHNHAAVAQPARATACRAEGHGFKSRRWRHVDVAEWRRHRSTKPESAGSTPAVDARSRRSSVDESTALRRRGSHVRVVPARRYSRVTLGRSSRPACTTPR